MWIASPISAAMFIKSSIKSGYNEKIPNTNNGFRQRHVCSFSKINKTDDMQFKIIIPNIEPESNISENQVILTSRQWKNNFLCQIYSQKGSMTLISQFLVYIVFCFCLYNYVRFSKPVLKFYMLLYFWYDYVISVFRASKIYMVLTWENVFQEY